jgi:hypothetical protein
MHRIRYIDDQLVAQGFVCSFHRKPPNEEAGLAAGRFAVLATSLQFAAKNSSTVGGTSHAAVRV